MNLGNVLKKVFGGGVSADSMDRQAILLKATEYLRTGNPGSLRQILAKAAGNASPDGAAVTALVRDITYYGIPAAHKTDGAAMWWETADTSLRFSALAQTADAVKR